MTLEELKEKVNQGYYHACITPEILSLDSFDFLKYMFGVVYEQRPYICFLDGTTAASDEYADILTPEEIEAMKTCKYYPMHVEMESLDVDKTIDTIIGKYANNGVFLNESTLFTPQFLVSDRGCIFFLENHIPEEISQLFIPYQKKNTFSYVSMDTHGFRTTFMPVKELTHSVEEFMLNYNDDLPLEELNEFIHADYSGIVILYGQPGCGKTTAIRHLISSNTDCHFLWLDQALLSQVNNSAFLDFLLQHKNSVFILEDCESLLKSRELTGNSLISSLLNLSDGILGDSLNIKFICTFNSQLNSIDKALLRKGRLKRKYEFKPLKKEKVQVIFDKLGITDTAKEMPLCDIYNYNEDNGANEVKKKVGFN